MQRAGGGTVSNPAGRRLARAERHARSALARAGFADPAVAAEVLRQVQVPALTPALDHTAVAGYLVQNRAVSAVFGSDRTIPRRERHYRALYQWWLVDGHPIMSPGASLHLHHLLLQPPVTCSRNRRRGYGGLIPCFA